MGLCASKPSVAGSPARYTTHITEGDLGSPSSPRMLRPLPLINHQLQCRSIRWFKRASVKIVSASTGEARRRIYAKEGLINARRPAIMLETPFFCAVSDTFQETSPA